MVDTITYRTTDMTRWGVGQGSDLGAPQIDINFFLLLQKITAVENAPDNTIDYFSVVGNQLFITMIDHTVFGPFTLPTAQWNFIEGGWKPLTQYHAFDVLTENGAFYIVRFDHVSAATFDPGANDGLGHNYYGLMLAEPQDALPIGGMPGQVLTKVAGSDFDTEWTSPTRNIGVYVEGAAGANELVLQYIVPEQMTFLTGLPNSQGFALTPPTVDQAYSIVQNGTVIGTVNFMPSPDEVFFAFAADVIFMPGDILSIIAPPAPDPHMTDVSITLVAILP